MRIRPPVHGWVQLAHTRRKDGTTQAEVLVDFGREDRPDVGARRRLVAERLSALELARPSGLLPVFTPGEVDRLMSAAHRIHRLGDGVAVSGRPSDVAIEIARDRAGSVVVFPALAA